VHVLHDLCGVFVLSDNDKITHVLVPRHEVLSKEESEKVLKELGVKAWQLPRIAQDDPAIRGIDTEVGQLVRITRKSELMGEYVVYRLVVPSFSQKGSTQKKAQETRDVESKSAKAAEGKPTTKKRSRTKGSSKKRVAARSAKSAKQKKNVEE